MDPRGTVGRIYKEDHYTLLHIKYKSSVPCGFGEDFFLYVFPIVCLWELMTVNDLRGGAIFYYRGMVGRIYKEDLYTLLHIEYKSSGPCGFGDFFMFFP